MTQTQQNAVATLERLTRQLLEIEYQAKIVLTQQNAPTNTYKDYVLYINELLGIHGQMIQQIKSNE